MTKSEFQAFIILAIVFASNLIFGIYVPTILMIFFTIFICLVKNIRLKREFTIVIFTAIFILLLSIFSINQESKSHNIIRDIMFFSMPIISLIFGYVLTSLLNSIEKTIKVYIYLGVVFLLFFIVSNFNSMFFMTKSQFSSYLQPPILSCSFLLLVIDLKYKYTKFSIYFKISLLFLFVISAVFTLSRTTMLVYLVFPIVSLGLIKFKMKNFLILFTCCLFLVVPISTVIKNNEVFKYKIENSIHEISLSDYESYENISNNWRGYEGYRTLSAYNNDGGVLQKVFGYGAGKAISLGLWVRLGDGYYEEVPIIHNGYLYILIKTGALGLTLYFILLFRVFLKNNVSLEKHYKFYSKYTIEQIIIRNVLKGCVCILALQTIVVGGWTSSESQLGVILLIGLLMGIREDYFNKTPVSNNNYDIYVKV